jgi:hypothetical protein
MSPLEIGKYRPNSGTLGVEEERHFLKKKRKEEERQGERERERRQCQRPARAIASHFPP